MSFFFKFKIVSFSALDNVTRIYGVLDFQTGLKKKNRQLIYNTTSYILPYIMIRPTFVHVNELSRQTRAMLRRRGKSFGCTNTGNPVSGRNCRIIVMYLRVFIGKSLSEKKINCRKKKIIIITNCGPH